MRLLTASIAFLAGLWMADGLSYQQESEVEDICTEIATRLVEDHDTDPVMAHWLFGAEPATHEPEPHEHY